jgi:hypothetical protein
MSYIGYSLNCRIFGKHESYKILCDLAYLEGQENYSIAPVEDYYLFFTLPIQSLFKIYLQLGGEKAQFKSSSEVIAAKQRIWKECKGLACGYPNSIIKSFELESQIGWVEQQAQKNGYTYKAGSRSPQLL